MPLDRYVRGLEGSWEDFVRVDELSEEWQSRRDVAWIDGSNYGDSLPLLIDGSDLDGHDLDDRQIGPNAAGLIHYPKDTVVYGEIAFGVALSPLKHFRQQEEYETHLNREAFGFCWVVHPQIASVIYKGLFGHSWLVPHCLALSIVEELACPRCGLCWWGPEGVMVYNLTGASVLVTSKDSAGVADRQLRTREQSYGSCSIGFFPSNSLQHLFGRGAKLRA
jgi:hypothetical protein